MWTILVWTPTAVASTYERTRDRILVWTATAVGAHVGCRGGGIQRQLRCIVLRTYVSMYDINTLVCTIEIL